MAAEPWRVPDSLWHELEPLIPKVERRFRYPGRKRHDDRACLEGILYVLRHGLPWRALPRLDALGPDLLAAPGRVGAGRGLGGAAGAPAAAAGRGRADRLVAGD